MLSAALPSLLERRPRPNAVRLPPLSFWLLASAAELYAITSSTPPTTTLAFAVLFAIIYLLWRPGEPPILLFAAVLQWIQAATILFYLNSYRLTFDAVDVPRLEEATRVSLLGVLVLAVGARVALVRNPGSIRQMYVDASTVRIPRAWSAYVVAFILSGILSPLASHVPAISQYLLALGSTRWALLFVCGVAVLQQRSGFGYLFAACATEFVFGFLGFFSQFRQVFFLLIVLALTSSTRLSRRRILALVVCGCVFAATSIVWTSIKLEYRDFLNQGSGEQVVLVPVEARITKLAELIVSLDKRRFDQGLDDLMVRVSYVSYFAQCLETVPQSIPYEHGRLWLEAFERVLMPRILFPNKPAIDDSERTSLYTGRDVAGAEQGTSISIGYIAESYIDFGPLLMYAPIFFLGMSFGLIYRWLAYHGEFRLLRVGFDVAIIVFGANTLETSNLKIVGGALLLILVTIVLRFTAFRAIATALGMRQTAT